MHVSHLQKRSKAWSKEFDDLLHDINVAVKDDRCLLESEQPLNQNKILNLECSNQQVQAELKKLREELKAEKGVKKAAQEALVVAEVKYNKQIKAANKDLNENLNAIAASVKSLMISMFGAEAPKVVMTAGNQLTTLESYCLELKEAGTLTLKVILEEANLPKSPQGKLKVDSIPPEMKEFHTIGRSLRGLSTAITDKLKLNLFFYPCSPDNKPIQPPAKTTGAAPAVTSPTVAESSRPKSPGKA